MLHFRVHIYHQHIIDAEVFVESCGDADFSVWHSMGMWSCLDRVSPFSSRCHLIKRCYAGIDICMRVCISAGSG